MKLFHLLKYHKSLAFTQIQLISLIYVSTGAILVFCPNFQFVKQVYFILLHYGGKYAQAFFYPYNPPRPNFGSFHVANILLDFSEVSVQMWCLWNKYQFGKSIWCDLFTASTYDQIMRICQVIAQSNTPSECFFIIWFLDQIWHLYCNYVKFLS